jgi:hypothetical protein
MKEKHPSTKESAAATATGTKRQSKITHITRSKITALLANAAVSSLTFRKVPTDMHATTTLRMRATPQSDLTNGTSNCDNELSCNSARGAS